MNTTTASRDSLNTYLTDIRRDELLTREEEADLARRWQQDRDETAASELVARNLRFVVKVAYGYRNYGVPMSDLIQEGNMGLIRAVEKFDPDKGTRLISYAVWWIKAYVHGCIVRSWSLVRVGTTQTQRRLFHRLPKALRKPGPEGEGSEARIERLAAELNARPRDIRMMLNVLSQRDLSLDLPVHGDPGGVTFRDRVQDGAAGPEDSTLERQDAAYRRRLLDDAISRLGDREQTILRLRYQNEEPLTLREVGSLMRLSRERVRQLEAQAIRKVKARVMAKYRYARAA